ncbi:MAG: HIT family protein [Phocaeicola sp.]
MATIFSKIVAGEIPSYKIAENAYYYAFLDINPLTKGHTLVIPKREVDYYFDLTGEEIAGIQQFAKQVAQAIQSVCPCKRIGQAVIGLEVPHAHIHLIPIEDESDMLFSNPRLEMAPEEFEQLAASIHNVWKGLSLYSFFRS